MCCLILTPHLNFCVRRDISDGDETVHVLVHGFKFAITLYHVTTDWCGFRVADSLANSVKNDFYLCVCWFLCSLSITKTKS